MFDWLLCVLQAHVPAFQGARVWPGPEGEVHPADGHRGRGRLSLQVPQRQVDGGRKGGNILHYYNLTFIIYFFYFFCDTWVALHQML